MAVTALEPDAEMAVVLGRRTAGLPVTVVPRTYEDWSPEERVDLLYAAASWHWTDPETRYDRAAQWLRPGGTLACFGGGTDLADPALATAVSALRDAVVPGEAVAEAESERGDLRWPGDEMAASPWFTGTREHSMPIDATMAADDFVGLLATVSAYVVLPEADRSDVLGRIRALLPDVVDVRRDLVLHLATRCP